MVPAMFPETNLVGYQKLDPVASVVTFVYTYIPSTVGTNYLTGADWNRLAEKRGALSLRELEFALFPFIISILNARMDWGLARVANDAFL